ncbi:MAG: tRNA pseudouridine(38-40) synthase TruA, partial [Oscillospiraceae bacterium]|nr:tRNA pseudouridine(38-40) synthase TruA [Oscillospiraceae bacterium]
EVLQDAMQKTLGERPDVKGCSRTDAGVHASGFCLSFFTKSHIPLLRLPLALNDSLPPDIRVFAAREVPENFHARYDADGKEYRYRIRTGSIDSPFDAPYTWRVNGKPDREKMQRAADACLGAHDFRSFMSRGSGAGEDTVRRVDFFQVEKEENVLTITIRADGYLYNMVRILVGTLVEIGMGRLPEDSMGRILKARDRAAAGPTAPAKGLCLTKVFYKTFFETG